MARSNRNILQQRSPFVRVLFFFAYTFFVYFLILYTIQDELIFHPDRSYLSPKDTGVTVFRELPVPMSDGVTVMTWIAKGNPDKPALLFFHGNAGQISQFAAPLLPLIDAGYPVLMAEYRGFGNTGGHMREGRLFADATELFDALQRLGYRRIIPVGYSFGSAPAIGLAYRRPVEGLALIAPFASLERMIADTPLPFARYVLRDSYRSDKMIQNVYVPLFILHGRADRLVPVSHAERLYHVSGSPRKKLVLPPKDTHSSVFFSGQFAATLLNWLRQFP